MDNSSVMFSFLVEKNFEKIKVSRPHGFTWDLDALTNWINDKENYSLTTLEAAEILNKLLEHPLYLIKRNGKFRVMFSPTPRRQVNFRLNPSEEKTTHQRIHVPGKLRHEVFKRDGYRCLECGATNKETRLHVDHIIPVSKGGLNDLNNLQTLCAECNMAKGTRTWRGGMND